jgi:hypothetical protein
VAVVGDLGEVLAALESVSDSAQLATAEVARGEVLRRQGYATGNCTLQSCNYLN